MSPNKISGLRQRTVNHTINKNRRCTEGADKKQIIVKADVIGIQESNESDAGKSTNKRPPVLFKINKGFLVDNVSCDPCPSLQFFHPDNLCKPESYTRNVQ